MIRYITRWALSTGIYVVEGEYTKDGKYFHGTRVPHVFVTAKEAFETLEKAEAQAHKMRATKLKRLRLLVKKFEDQTWVPRVVES